MAYSHPHLMIQGWKPPSARMRHITDRKVGKTYGLEQLDAGWTVNIRFTEMRGSQDMEVRATNWSCESEPDFIASREDCRSFYKRLVKAGATPIDYSLIS